MGNFLPFDFQGSSPKEFGTDAPTIRTKQYVLTNARDLEEMDLGGTCLWAVDASDLIAWIDIRINDQLSNPIRFRMGMFIRGAPYSRIFVSHDAQPGKTLTILYVREVDISKFEIANPSMFYNSVGLSNATVFTSVADVALGAAATSLVLAANADRREAIITNLPGNISTIRLGDAAAGAAEGIPVVPGETFRVNTTAPIYAYNPGVAQNVGVSYTQD